MPASQAEYRSSILRTRSNPSSLNSLKSSPIGTLVPISGHDGRFGEDYEAEAFVPVDLPESIDLPGSAWMTVSDAAAELGRLDAAASLIPRPQLVARVATRREAIGTSALEGTFADLTDLFAAEVLPEDEQDKNVAPNVREIMNYARAADSAFSWIKERPITLGTISALQSQIVRALPVTGQKPAPFERPRCSSVPNTDASTRRGSFHHRPAIIYVRCANARSAG